MLDAKLGANDTVRAIQSRAATVLASAGLTANGATILAAVIGVSAGFSFALDKIPSGIALLAISAALDALDGTLAREHGGATPFGGVLDLVGDRVVETAVIIGIAWPRPEIYLPALLLVGTWYVNITVFLAVGAALERRGPKLIVYPPGILERSEALIFFALLAIARPLGPMLCYGFAALELVTAAQRLRFGLSELRADRRR
ncbi:MAG: CDP-alcohol phosphatidyltransferase family protein [Candidatus Binataceae bacterium]